MKKALFSIPSPSCFPNEAKIKYTETNYSYVQSLAKKGIELEFEVFLPSW